MSGLGVADVFVVLVSLLAVIAVAGYVSIRRRKRDAGSSSSAAQQFFLAGRSMPAALVAASLFASNIGTEHFVGQAGTAASYGISAALYDWVAAYMLLALAWIFAPVYHRCQLTTIPELLEKRFNKQCRVAFVTITLLAYAISKIGSSLYAGVVVLETVAGLSVWESLPLILIGTALYTVAGGLEMVIFLFGGFMGTIISLKLVGGISGLFNKLERDGLEQFPHLIRPATDDSFPWPGMFFGIPIVSIWYWCVDQEMAQRVISAKSLNDAQLGSAVAGLMKALPAFITVFPGMVARSLYEACILDDSKHAAWCSTNLGDTQAADKAYPLLVVNEFPTGVKGIMVASFLAAMMSSLSSVFNSASTIVTYDIYIRFFSATDARNSSKLVSVGRYATVAVVLIAFCWIPIIAQQKGGLFLVTQTAMSHLAPPISALFVAGLFIKRANGRGAFTGLMCGTLFGVIRLTDFLFNHNKCTADDVTNKANITGSNWLRCLNFNYFAILLFSFTLIVIILASFVFHGPNQSKVTDFMFKFPWEGNSPVRKPSSIASIEMMEAKNARPGDSDHNLNPPKDSSLDPVDQENPNAPLTGNTGSNSSSAPVPTVLKTNRVKAGLPAIFVSLSVLIVITSLIAGFH